MLNLNQNVIDEVIDTIEVKYNLTEHNIYKNCFHEATFNNNASTGYFVVRLYRDDKQVAVVHENQDQDYNTFDDLYSEIMSELQSQLGY